MNEKNVPYFAEEFLHYLQTTKGLSPITTKSYRVQLKGFLRWVICRNKASSGTITREAYHTIDISKVTLSDVAEIKGEDLKLFFWFCRSVLGHTPATLSLSLSVLRSFFSYQVEIAQTLAQDPTIEITAEEINEMCEIGEIEEGAEDTPNYIRNRCIDLLNGQYGIPPAALARMNCRDITKDSVSFYGSNSMQKVVVPLEWDCICAILAWVDVRNQIPNRQNFSNLFLSVKTGRPLSASWINQIIIRPSGRLSSALGEEADKTEEPICTN